MKNNWRNNVRISIIGMPVAGLLAYVILIYISRWPTLFLFAFVLITSINIGSAILNKMGYSASSFLQKIMSHIRGPVVYSRPWWLRERWSNKQ